MGTIKLDIAVGILSKLGPGLASIKTELKQALSKLDINVQDSKKIMSAFGVDPKNTAKSLQEIVALFKTAKNDIFKEANKLTNSGSKNLDFANKNELMASLKVMFDEALTGLSAGMPARFDKALSKLGTLQQPAAIKRLIASIEADLQTAISNGLVDKKTVSRVQGGVADAATKVASRDAAAALAVVSKAEDERLAKVAATEKKILAERRKYEKLGAQAQMDMVAEEVAIQNKRIANAAATEKKIAADKKKFSSWFQTNNLANPIYVADDQSKAIAKNLALNKAAAQQTIQLSKEVADKTKGYSAEATRASTQAMSSGVRATAQAADQAAVKVKATLAEIKALQSKQGVALKVGDFKEIDALAARITKLAARAKVELGQVWSHAGTQVPAFTKKFEDAMTAMSYRFTHVGFQFTIFSSMALNAFRKPLAAALEFNRELGFIQAIAKSSSLSFDGLRDSILQMGTNSIYSVQKIAEGVRTLAQAGFDAAQSMQAVPAVLDFAAAGMVSLDEAAKIAFNTMTIFSGSQGMGSLPRLLSEFAAAANKSNTDVKGLGIAMKTAAPLARQLGYTASETMAILGQLSKGGLDASLAGTSLRNMLQRLLNPSKEASKAMASLGISTKDFADAKTGNFIKFPELIDKFRYALEGLNATEQAEAISEIFKTRSTAGFLITLQQGSDALRAMQKEIETSGVNALIASERAETLWGSFERMKNAVSALTTTLGTSLASALGPFAEGLRVIASALVTALQGSAALRGLVGVGALITGLAAVVAAGAGAFTLLASAVTSAMGAFPGLLRLLGRANVMKLESTVITKQMTAAQVQEALVAREAAKAQMALNVAAGKSALGATTLAQSWRAAGFAMKSFAILSIIPDLIAVGTALKAFTGIISDNADQAARARAEIEKYNKIIQNKPLLDKDKFELLSDKEKSEEIKRLAAIEAKAYSVIADIERRQENKIAWGFFTKGQLEKEMAEAKKELADAVGHESFYVSSSAAKLRLYTPAGESEDKSAVTDTLDFFQKAIFDHNKKATSKTIFDLPVVLGDIDKATDSYLTMADSISKVGISNQETAKHSAQLHNVTLNGMETSIQAAGEYVGELLKVASLEEHSATRAIKATKLATTYKLTAIKNWKDAAEVAIKEYAVASKAFDTDIAASKKQMYATAQGELKKLIDNSLKMYEKHSKAVVEIEANTQKERLAEKQRAEDLMAASNKLKSEAQIAADAQRKIAELTAQWKDQIAKGDIERAKETLDAIDALSEKASNGVKDHYADALLERDKLAEEIAKKEEQRTERLRESATRNDKSKTVDSIDEEIRLLRERNKEENNGLEAKQKRIDEQIAKLREIKPPGFTWNTQTDDKTYKEVQDKIRRLQEERVDISIKIDDREASKKLEEDIRLLEKQKKEARNANTEGNADLADLDKELEALKERKNLLDESLIPLSSQNKLLENSLKTYEERKKFESLSPYEKRLALDGQALKTQEAITLVMEGRETLRQVILTREKNSQAAYLGFLKEVQAYYSDINKLSKGLLGQPQASLPAPPQAAGGAPKPSAEAQVSVHTKLNATDEVNFQKWYAEWAAKSGIHPDPDSPLQNYDYRGAFKVGVTPEIDITDGKFHWPSEFKDLDHPNRFVEGVDTITGKIVESLGKVQAASSGVSFKEDYEGFVADVLQQYAELEKPIEVTISPSLDATKPLDVKSLGDSTAKAVSEGVTPAVTSSLTGPEAVKAADSLANNLGQTVGSALTKAVKNLANTLKSTFSDLSFNIEVTSPTPKMARGGTIYGSGNADTVPILAQPGEFMLSRKMVSLFGGLNILEAIRSKVMGGTRTSISFGMPAMATGGAIGGGSPAGSYALDLNLTTSSGSTRGRLYGEKDVIESVINALRREALTQRG